MSDFFFADDYILESGKTRDFYMKFLKGLVHKNNNLVGVIQGFASLSMLDSDISSDIRENTAHVDGAARSMTDLNKVVLSASGCGRVERAGASLQDMFKFHEDKAGEICGNLGVDFTFHANPKLPGVLIDTSKFSDIFEALIRNAAESAAETSERKVTVEVHKSNDASSTRHVDLFIRNASRDIPADKIPEFFEGFYSSKSNDHYGLGLTLAAVLCGQMGVQLGMKSQDSTVTTWLAIPVAE